MMELRSRLVSIVQPSRAEVGLVLIDLGNGQRIEIQPHESMHAASTMKVPVLYELYRRAESGEFAMDATIPVVNRFRSLVGDTTFTLSPGDDSDSTLYARVGGEASWRELATLMITRSSNLATNILIERLGANRVRSAMESIGAGDMRVLRGVEDGPAFRRGLNNTTTAAAFARVLEAIATCRGFDAPSCSDMLGILSRQEFNDMIPAGLPDGVPVAHKTGWIQGIRHDGAIIQPPGRAALVLVILTRGLADAADADRLGATLTREIWQTLR
jgi:beta-lactamase class A